MNDAFNLIISIVIPLLFGFNLLSIFFSGQRLDNFLKLGLSYGLGTGVIALWMLYIGVSGLPFNVQIITLPIIVMIIILTFINLYQNYKASVNNPIKSHGNLASSSEKLDEYKHFKLTVSTFLIFFIGINILYIFWRALNIPIISYDAIATIAFKAKIFFYEEKLPPLTLLPHQTYPLLVPFTLTWTAINLGAWSDQLVQITFPCLLLSFLMIFYKFLRYFTDRLWALFGVALLLSSNFFIVHAAIAYRDFTLMYFNCTTIMLLLLWRKSGIFGFLLTASLFSGISTFVKLEGTSFLLIHCLLALIIIKNLTNLSTQQKIKHFLAFSIPGAFICFSFLVYKFLVGATKEGVGIVDKTGMEFSLEKIQLVPQIFQSFAQNLFLSGNWNILWLALLVSLVLLSGKKKNAEIRLTLLALGLYFTMYFLVALFTMNYTWIAGENNSTTLSRLILHFFPLAVLSIILLNYPDSADEQKPTP